MVSAKLPDFIMEIKLSIQRSSLYASVSIMIISESFVISKDFWARTSQFNAYIHILCIYDIYMMMKEEC